MRSCLLFTKVLSFAVIIGLIAFYGYLIACISTNVFALCLDLLGMNAGGQGAALGFQFYGGPVITLLASKTSRQYIL